VTCWACKLKRTVLHYQDAIEEPVEDDTNKLWIDIITGKLRVVACVLTDGPKLDVYQFSNAFFVSNVAYINGALGGSGVGIDAICVPVDKRE